MTTDYGHAAGRIWRVGRRSILVIALVCAAPSRVRAQQYDQAGRLIKATYPRAFAWNVAIGGLTAAVRAALAGRDVRKPFFIGLGGGAIHGAGKLVGTGKVFPSAVGGLFLSGVGASVVGNAGAGVAPFSEILIPFGIGRFYIRPHKNSHVRFVLDAFASTELVHAFTRGGLEFDWRHTLQTGTPVFSAPTRLVYIDHKREDGVTVSSVVAISGLTTNYPSILRHEMVHVEQYVFVDETIGRPLEAYLRSRIDPGGHVPRWLSFGSGDLAVHALDVISGGKHGLYQRYQEWEAYGLMR